MAIKQEYSVNKDSILHRIMVESGHKVVYWALLVEIYTLNFFFLLLGLLMIFRLSSPVEIPMLFILGGIAVVSVAGLVALHTHVTRHTFRVDLDQLDPVHRLEMDSWIFLGVDCPLQSAEDHLRYWQRKVSEAQATAPPDSPTPIRKPKTAKKKGVAEQAKEAVAE